MKLIKCIIIILLVFLVFKGFSQNHENVITLNVNGGTNLFFGDIKQYRFYPVFKNENEWNFAYGLAIEKEISNFLSIRGSILQGNISGTKRKIDKYFKGDIIELNANFKLNLNNTFGKIKERKHNFFFSLGFGLSQFRTKLYKLGNHSEIASSGYGNGNGIDGRTSEFVFPTSIGYTYNINKHISTSLEYSIRFLSTDVLDFTKGGFSFDIYNYTALSISYHFLKKVEKKRLDNSIRNQSKVDKPHKSMPVFDNTKETYESKVAEKEQQSKKENLINTNTLTSDTVSNLISSEYKKNEILKISSKKTEDSLRRFKPDNIHYSVQILAKQDKLIDYDKIYQKIGNRFEISENKIGDLYIYTIGSFNDYYKAKELLKRIRRTKGFDDAFIVTFKNGRRVEKLPTFD